MIKSRLLFIYTIVNLVLDKYFGFSLLKEEMLKTIFFVIVFVTIYCYKQKQRYSVNETIFFFKEKRYRNMI